MKWTDSQQAIIDYRQGTLLVSAAAGSGKTAVLVQRLLDWVVQDGKNIDEFLVVTFTRAAAGQMRTKIRRALEDMQEQHPDDQHIIRQLSLVHRAHIMTIDSFCKQVVDDNFQFLGIDPAMRIMDETEGVLMQDDVLTAVLEQVYETDAEGMAELHRYMGEIRENEKIRRLVGKLYQQANSMPEPKEWLQSAVQEVQAEEPEALYRQTWMKLLVKECKELYREVAELPERIAAEYDRLEEGYRPKQYDKYQQYFREECRLAEAVCGAQTYADLKQAFCTDGRAYKRFIWKNSGMPESHYATELWQTYSEGKKAAAELVKPSMEEIVEQQKAVAPILTTVLRLTERFMDRYREEKQNKNCMDFGDVEHYALQALSEGMQDGAPIPTETALQLRNRYTEILIDEYQDSNDLQEAILTSIARKQEGNYTNLFMVGDVKQSIYKFRMARPQLFQRKYQTYSDDLAAEGVTKKIELRQNFRSRREVLEAVNLWFYQIMTEALGGIDYNEQAALVPGREYESMEQPGDDRTELWILDPYTKEDENEAEHAENTGEEPENMELEARLTAARIKSLCNGEAALPVWDEDRHAYRTCEYRDIVILLRSLKGWSEIYHRVLTEEGIPVYADSGKGYFDSVEVRDLLSVLSVIDNARNDIPLAGALRSAMVGLSSEELAHIRGCYQRGSLWEIITGYTEDPVATTEKRPELKARLQRFLERLAKWKQMKNYSTIREIIWSILDTTGYYEYVGAMPGGSRRQGNIRKLIDKASAYENTGYRGLFDFLRYIERVKIHEQDFGEAAVLGANDNLVRVMTIHKSKGLEFPVVFLCGCGKKFNQQDSRDTVLVDADCYLAVNRKYPEKHYYEKTAKREYLLQHMKTENQAEEMRILYVGMTRAQEKLILIGTVGKTMAEKDEDYQVIREHYRTPGMNDRPENTGSTSGYRPAPLGYQKLRKEDSYLGWGLRCLVPLLNQPAAGAVMTCHVVDARELDVQALQEWNRLEERKALWEQRIEYPTSGELVQQLTERFRWQYPHMLAAGAKGKLSVSEIKKMSQLIDEPEAEQMQTAQMQTERLQAAGGHRGYVHAEATAGAAYGTLMHLVMEKLPLSDMESPEHVQQGLLALEQRGILTAEERKRIMPEKIWHMIDSKLGRRMAEAQRRGVLYRERQFVIGIPMSQVYGEGEEQDLELVQGVIDAYFEEDGELVLMDYKTDRVTPGDDGQELIRKYHAQLEYYCRTLEQLTGKRVKERYLYSFYLEREILLT